MANYELPYCLTLLAPVAISAAGQVNGSTRFWPGDIDSGTFVCVADYTSGTATLDVAIEVSPDGGTTWFKRFGFTQITADITEAIDVVFSRIGCAGAISTVTFNSTTLLTGALNANCVMPRHFRVSYQGATSDTIVFPSLAVYFIGHRNSQKSLS